MRKRHEALYQDLLEKKLWRSGAVRLNRTSSKADRLKVTIVAASLQICWRSVGTGGPALASLAGRSGGGSAIHPHRSGPSVAATLGGAYSVSAYFGSSTFLPIQPLARPRRRRYSAHFFCILLVVPGRAGAGAVDRPPEREESDHSLSQRRGAGSPAAFSQCAGDSVKGGPARGALRISGSSFPGVRP